MNEEKKILKGFIGLVKPGVSTPEFIPVEWDDTDESKDALLKKLIKIITDKENGKITNLGLLPSPLNSYTAFIDYVQFYPETKYNFNFFGNPFYGNVGFLKVDLATENKDIIPIIEENDKDTILKFTTNIKKFESESGIYKAMSEVNKEEFLEEFIKEQTNAVKESSKKIDEEIPEELKEANKEVEDLIKSGKITREEFENMKKEI